MRRTWLVACREFRASFESPIATVVLVAFLAVTSLTFFAGFFERDTASVRTLFELFPLLLLLLVPPVTMRLWAEERRVGSDEILLTLPMRPLEAVIGKFLGAWALLGLALLLTVPIPLTVAALANVGEGTLPFDWGPVWGGYIGAFFMGAVYLAIGCLVSSLTRNQIVAFVVTLVALTSLVVAGMPQVLLAMPKAWGPWLEAMSPATRYAAVARGVVDVRDVVYTLSVTGLCLWWNGLVLESRRQAG